VSAHFLVSADGGSRGNPGPAAYGTLVIDSAGNVIVEIAEFFDHETNNFAEYRGAIAGLEYVHAIDPDASLPCVLAMRTTRPLSTTRGSRGRRTPLQMPS
jgi:probable phosphoglycerate mutase